MTAVQHTLSQQSQLLNSQKCCVAVRCKCDAVRVHTGGASVSKPSCSILKNVSQKSFCHYICYIQWHVQLIFDRILNPLISTFTCCCLTSPFATRSNIKIRSKICSAAHVIEYRRCSSKMSFESEKCLRSHFATTATMGWLRLVGFLKLQVPFVEYSLCHRAFFAKETYTFKKPNSRSHPMYIQWRVLWIVDQIWLFAASSRTTSETFSTFICDTAETQKTDCGSDFLSLSPCILWRNFCDSKDQICMWIQWSNIWSTIRFENRLHRSDILSLNRYIYS